jgi:hypothetical protein
MGNNEKTKERYKICEKYGDFFNSFIKPEKDELGNYKDGDISKEIYHQVFFIHYLAGKYSADSNREVNHSFSGIFQDLIAYYLKVFLDGKYEVFLEKKEEKFQPDILITKNGKNYFIIEVKTNIGWSRNAVDDGTFADRIKNMSEAFKVKEENIIYIFESHGNVSKKFTEIFWNEKDSKPQKRPKNSPLSQIYPLFNSTDPYYMDEFNRKDLYDNTYFDLVKGKIDELAAKNIVTKFEDIIKLIEKE